MRGIAALIALTLMLAACSEEQQQPEQQQPQANTPEGKAPQKSDGSDEQKEGTKLIIQYKDLEEYSGQTITLEGILKVYPKFKGRHAMLVLDSGLVVYIPHADAYWRGENWWLEEGKRVKVTGTVHTFVGHDIDGMNGPFLDEPSYPSETANDQPAPKEGEPKKASNQ
jgi:hypothetical protein